MIALLRLSIPSPPTAVWHLWMFPVRADALGIIAGVAGGIIGGRYAARRHRWRLSDLARAPTGTPEPTVRRVAAR